jgi:hypothetical protein
MTIRRSLSTAVLGLCTVVAVPAMGQQSSSTARNNQNTQSQTAGKQVAKAQADVNKLLTDLNKLRAKVRVQVLAKPEWAQVMNSKKAAEATVDAARKNALSGLRNKPEYKALQKERDEAQQLVTNFNTPGSQVSQADFEKASNTVVTDGYAMKKMETDALKEDPKYAEAITQLDSANAKMKEAESQVDVALKDDQEYQNASKQLDSAKTTLATAKTQLAQARQQEEASREQQAKSRQQQQSGGGSTGR